MAKDHTDSEGGNSLPPLHGLLLVTRIFYMHHSTDKIGYSTAFVTPIVYLFCFVIVVVFVVVVVVVQIITFTGRPVPTSRGSIDRRRRGKEERCIDTAFTGCRRQRARQKGRRYFSFLSLLF